MKRGRNDDRKRLGPAAAALRNRNVFRDYRGQATLKTTAEILADAVDMQRAFTPTHSDSARVVIRSREELAVYRQKCRAELEEKIKRGYKFLGNFIKYARWEAEQKDYIRMRSVMERAIQFHGDDEKLWRDYGELEASKGFVKEAREVFHRGVVRLPFSMDLWLKYILLELAAGSVHRVRDVFNRWTALSPNAPHYAFELYVLFEVVYTKDVSTLRPILKRYVQTSNTPASWLLYSGVEREVLKDEVRAEQVLETALQALPEEKLWTPQEHEVTLQLCRAYATSQDKEEKAMHVYQELLDRIGTSLASASSSLSGDLESNHIFSKLLAEYSQYFRTRKGKSKEEADHLTRMQSRQLYTNQLLQNPEDLDARLSLYLVLRDTQKQEALDCLRPTLEFSLEDPFRAQRIVLLRMELAKQLEATGAVQEAREIFANALRAFPFQHASCPQLWEEAAALEQRHGDFAQSRKMLQAAVRVTNDVALVEPLVQLEQEAYRRDLYASRAEYVNQLRNLFKDVLQQHPFHLPFWLRFAKLEEEEGLFPRAQALLQAGIQTLTKEATQQFSVSLNRRYDLLKDVDRLWARRVGLQRKLIKRLEKESGVEGTAETLSKAESDMDTLLYELLKAVWSDYRYEALYWRTHFLQEAAADTPVPVGLPPSLQRAVDRFSEAVEGVHQYYTSSSSGGETKEAQDLRVNTLRKSFKDLLEYERALLRRSVGYEEGKVGYDEAQVLQQWVNLLLSPLVGAWGRLEVLYGDRESLAQVKSVANQSAVKKRTRLFKNR